MTFDLDTWVETDARFPPKKTRPLVGKLIRKGRAKLPAGSYWGDYCGWCWTDQQNIRCIVTDGDRVRTTVCPRCGMGKIETIEEERQ